MKIIKPKEKKAVISIVENPDAFKVPIRFIGYSKKTVKNMAYTFINQVANPRKWFHHRPRINPGKDGQYIATVVCYGNVTVINGDGDTLYTETGLPVPDPDILQSQKEPLHPNVQVKQTTKEKTKHTVDAKEIAKKINEYPICPKCKAWGCKEHTCLMCKPARLCKTHPGLMSHQRSKHPDEYATMYPQKVEPKKGKK